MLKTNKYITLVNDIRYDQLCDTPNTLLTQNIEFSDDPAILANVSDIFYMNESDQYRGLVSSTVVPNNAIIEDLTHLKKLSLVDTRDFVVIKNTNIECYLGYDEHNYPVSVLNVSSDPKRKRDVISLTLFIREVCGQYYSGYGYSIHNSLYIIVEANVTREYKDHLLPTLTIGSEKFTLPRPDKKSVSHIDDNTITLLEFNTGPVRNMNFGNIKIGIGITGGKKRRPYYTIGYYDGDHLLNQLCTKDIPEKTKCITDLLTDGSGILRIQKSVCWDSVTVDEELHKYSAIVMEVFDFNNEPVTIRKAVRVNVLDTTVDLQLGDDPSFDEINLGVKNYVEKHN